MTVRVLLEPPDGPLKRPARKARAVLDYLRWMFLLAGAAALGYTGYVYLDSTIYQAYEERAFEREAAPDSAALGPAKPHPSDPSLVGRIAIPRLGVRAIVKEGVDEKTLRRAVGHVPETVRPGVPGNVGLAGHRDSFFRGLRNVRKDDRIVVETLDGRFEYAVESMKVVRPSDVDVLAPTREPVLTLVTCYPFNFVGKAPKRYIVRARQVSAEAGAPAASD